MDPSTFAGCAAAYLAAAWSAPDLGVSNARRILGGASRHTWSIDATWRDAAGESHSRGLIFRLDPPSSLLESNRGTEYAAYRALCGLPGIPLPEPLLIEDDGGAFGMPFFVMQRLDGTAWPHELLTPAFADRRDPIVRQMFRILGTIASVDYQVIGLDRVLTPPPVDAAWAVELERWERTLHHHDLGPMPITSALIRELRRHPPPPVPRIGVVHGDYRVGNVLFTPDGVTGILDWEMTHLGDPHEDLAWSMARNWRSRASPELIGSVLDPADALGEWETTSAERVNPESLRWWQLFTHVKANAIWATAAHEFSTGRTDELMFGTMGWRNTGTQEKWALEDLGVLAP